MDSEKGHYHKMVQHSIFWIQNLAFFPPHVVHAYACTRLSPCICTHKRKLRGFVLTYSKGKTLKFKSFHISLEIFNIMSNSQLWSFWVLWRHLVSTRQSGTLCHVSFRSKLCYSNTVAFAVTVSNSCPNLDASSWLHRVCLCSWIIMQCWVLCPRVSDSWAREKLLSKTEEVLEPPGREASVRRRLTRWTGSCPGLGSGTGETHPSCAVRRWTSSEPGPLGWPSLSSSSRCGWAQPGWAARICHWPRT